MKKLLLILTLALFTNSLQAQDPELFNHTWYLYTIDYEIDPDVFVASFDPPISPTLILEANLQFSGTGACNTFEGNLTFEVDGFTVADKTNTTNSCGFFEDEFEGGYFGFFEPKTFFNTSIIDNGSDKFTLVIAGGPFTTMTFQNTPILSNPDNTKISVQIFPNPASDILNISSDSKQLERTTVYNMSGQTVMEQKNNLDSIDVSTLQSGVYFIEVFSETGKAVKRFVKK